MLMLFCLRLSYLNVGTSERSLVLSFSNVNWSMCDLARRRVPGGSKKAVKELQTANEQQMSFRTFKNYLLDKYPSSNGNASNDSAITINPNDFSLYHGDMVEVLEDFDTQTVDLVIADPPYNVTDWDWDKRGTPEEFVKETEQWLGAVQHVLKPKYHLFWFCSPKFSADIEMVMRRMELPIKSRIVWNRRNLAMGSDAQERFIDSWEMIFHCGNKSLNWNSEWNDERFDVQTFAVPQTNFHDQKKHPTQKPLGLIKRLVEFGSEPGAILLDPFAGSGTTGHASALVGKRHCILIEKEEEYVNVIKSRLVGL